MVKRHDAYWYVCANSIEHTELTASELSAVVPEILVERNEIVSLAAGLMNVNP